MNNSFDSRMNNPVWQALAVLMAAIILECLNWLVNLMSADTSEPTFAWSVSTAMLLFFAIMNSLLSLRAESFVKYWQASMYSFMGLAGATALVAWGFSGIPIGEAGSYKWIYTVVSIGFIVFLSMVNFMKIIVRFAEREEWHQPRK